MKFKFEFKFKGKVELTKNAKRNVPKSHKPKAIKCKPMLANWLIKILLFIGRVLAEAAVIFLFKELVTFVMNALMNLPFYYTLDYSLE